MFEQAPSFIAVLNGPDHRVELANAGLLKLVDERRQIIGKTVREAMPDAVAQGYLTLLDQAFATGERVVRTGARYAVGLAPGVETKECFVDFVFQPSPTV